jgi:hypothetical protein
MHENDQLIGSVEHITDGEITSAIHYLDPDASGEGTRHNAYAVLGIDLGNLSFLIVLAGALVYVWLYL